MMEIQVREVLKDVLDPEIGVNIVDLGLVYDIVIPEEEKVIAIDLTLTTPGCPMSSTIVRAVKEALRKNFPTYEPEVELVWEPAWSPEKITEDGRTMMGM
ncbi:MAG: metal-sulfur cluster assembly factor [Sphingobacteriales bacterium]|nr:MAG: metal-sulfur cluster assembly factor [Sphingobacteriales bacterium]